jgi:hypothetical protein
MRAADGTGLPGEIRRYPGVGGVLAWRGLLVSGVLAACAAAVGDWVLLTGCALVGLALDGFDRSVVLEVSRHGFARARAVAGACVGPARAVRWEQVDEIRTRWRMPRDHTALVTTVVGRDGGSISFGTEMGFRTYRMLVTDVARRAPGARRTGLTDELLAEGVPTRRG